MRTGKEMLSRTPATVLHIPLFNHDLPLGREQLDQLAAPILDRTVATTREIISAAGISPDQLAGLFLVGGASRTPLAATLLHRALGVPPTVIDQPELAVADGSLPAAAPPPPARAVVPAGGPALPAGRSRRRLPRPAVGLAAAAGVLLAVVAGTAIAFAAANRDPDPTDPTRPAAAGTTSPSPTPRPSPTPIADPCLPGTWTLTTEFRDYPNIGDGIQAAYQDGRRVFYLRPDGTARLEFDRQRDLGTGGGHEYEIIWTGSIDSHYRTSDGVLLWSNLRPRGEWVVYVNGAEDSRGEIGALTEQTRYLCTEDMLTIYISDGAAEYSRTSHDWDG